MIFFNDLLNYTECSRWNVIDFDPMELSLKSTILHTYFDKIFNIKTNNSHYKTLNHSCVHWLIILLHNYSVL